ncbi:MAG: hypothetical protein AB8G16_04360 [Gammaproteobacteria bacterium]
MKNSMLKILGIALFAMLAQQALAYTTSRCLNRTIKWRTTTKPMQLSRVSFPAGGSWRPAMVSGINIFNRNPSKFRFTASFNDANVALNNGENESWFTTAPSIFNGSGAVAMMRWRCTNPWWTGRRVYLLEADILFNSATGLSRSNSVADLRSHGGTQSSFHTAAVHELGHGAGLKHESRRYNMMGADTTHVHANGNAVSAYLGEDASNGLVFLYGQTSGTHEDLSISQFERTGASGEYSLHSPTEVKNRSGGFIWTRRNDPNGETAYEVDRGQRVQLELTYENNGRNTQTEDIGFYVSTNNGITTADTRIATVRGLTLGRDVTSTRLYNLTIPNGLTRNRFYYLGAIIDPSNRLAEVSESNNAARIPIWIN